MPGIARRRIGPRRQRAVERSEHDDLREPRQHEHHDDAAEVAQHAGVAVLHLDRPGEPERRQQISASQCQMRASQLRSAATGPLAPSGARSQPPHRPALLQHDDAEEDVIDQPDRLQQRVVRGVRQAEQQPDLGDARSRTR